VQNMSKQNQQAVMQVLGARVVNWPKFMWECIPSYCHHMLTRCVMVWYSNSCLHVGCISQGTLHFVHQKMLDQPPYSWPPSRNTKDHGFRLDENVKPAVVPPATPGVPWRWNPLAGTTVKTCLNAHGSYFNSLCSFTLNNPWMSAIWTCLIII
jgi:hypothetical protein